jgi:hypothetical protein
MIAVPKQQASLDPLGQPDPKRVAIDPQSAG